MSNEMSNENEEIKQEEEIVQVEDNVQEEPVQEEVPEVKSEVKSEVTSEQEDEEIVKAKARGWDPSKGDKTAKEFNLIGEVIELKKLVQKRDKEQEQIIQYNRDINKKLQENFKAQLQAKLAYAEETGDIKQIKELTAEQIRMDQEEYQRNQQNEVDKAGEAEQWFKSRNSTWYNPQYPELENRVAQVTTSLIQRGNYKDYLSLAEAVEHQMRAELAVNPTYNHLLQVGQVIPRPTVQSSPSAVSVSKQGTSQAAAYKTLNSSEKAMYDALNRMNAKSGIKPMSVKDFQDQMNKDSEI